METRRYLRYLLSVRMSVMCCRLGICCEIQNDAQLEFFYYPQANITQLHSLSAVDELKEAVARRRLFPYRFATLGVSTPPSTHEVTDA
jgi:hypothetical protein